MTPTQQKILAAAIAVAVWGGSSNAQAQTIVNLTNLDPTTTSGYGLPTTSSSNASTSLDLLNTTTALSNGGLFPGAVSTQSQAAYNQLNTIGINANGTVSPVVLGNQTPVAGTPNMVEINTITSAFSSIGVGAATLTGTSSSTINNINAAISSAVNPIIGAAAGVNNPWTGGYGGAASGAAVTANQVGVNSINGVGAAFADGTNVALSQLPGAPQPASAITGTIDVTNTSASAISRPATIVIGGITYTVSGGSASLAAGGNTTYTLTASAPTYGAAGVPGTNVTGLTAGLNVVGTPTLTQASSSSPTVIQGGSLNMSTVNTLLASATAGTVGINGNNGVDASSNPVRGNQTAVNTFNASTLVGTNLAVGAQQLADGLNANQSTMASINRALAYSPGSQSANIDPSVTNLNQTASVGVNALNLQQAGTTATNATLSGLQSTGSNAIALNYAGGNTTVGGANAIPVVTNQIVASTVGAGGFMPTGGTSSTDWAAFSSTLASGMPQPGSAGYPGATTTGTNTSAFLGGSFNPNVTGATNPYTTLNAGTVSVASANQAINLTNNTVSAGSAASPVNVTFGPAGFEQRTGTVGIATNSAGAQPDLAVGLGAGVTSPGGLSNAQALTGVGSSSISNLGQSFQTANNTFQGSGNVTGSMTQSASGIAFNAANIESGTGLAAVAAVNGGSGMVGPVVAPATANNSTGYTLGSSVNNTNSALNNAVAGAVFGPVSLSSVSQTGTTYANVAAATGTIDTAASGTLAQNLGNITNYSGVQNAAVANSVASGNVAVTGTTQSLGVTGNAVQAAAINGSIAQLAEGSSSYNATTTSYSDAAFGARNAVLASSGSGQLVGQGSAVLNSTTQTNTSTLNAIQSAGALGSSTVPASLSQQSGTVNTQLGNSAFSSTVTSGQQNLAMAAPSNLAVVQATNGAGGSATANNTVQTAGLSVNSLAGGTSAGLGITGQATQVSYGQSTSIGNQALAYAANAPRGDATLTGGTGVAGNAAVGSTMLGAQGVMSGNAALTNQQQLATQSLNTMALAGANNGNLNQATFGATNQTTGNQLYAQSNGGYALTTGAQTATNAVNVITAR